MRDIYTYIEMKNFSERWLKITKLLNKQEMQELNDWGMKEAEKMSYASMIQKDRQAFIKEYSFPIE